MLKELAVWVAYGLAGLPEGGRLGGALEFFVYETIKIFALLAVMIFAVSFIRSWFPPERARRLLSHKKIFIGNVLAAMLGIVTPFCSCSAVPLFIGFVEAGVPLGVTFSFLIASPMINEVAVVLLLGMFGLKVAAIYIGAGLAVAITSGIVIGKLGLERWVEPQPRRALGLTLSVERAMTLKGRVAYARRAAADIIRTVWLYVIVAIGIGAFIHGYAPSDFLARYAGAGNPFAVPLAVLMGIPLYASAAGIVPVVYALMEKGLAMGTVLAFMMAVTGISFPEMVILRKVLKPQLLAVFAGIMAVAIIAVGYLFNMVLG